ncbi:MAG: Yip1 family protein [Candidatus Electrothrix sp. YB6]
MTDKLESKTYTWQEAWKQAVTHPSVKTFAELKNDSTVSGNRAYKWIFMGGLIGSLPDSLICAPFVSIISLVCTAIYVFIINLIARCLRGTGTYKQLLFVTAAYTAPLGIISGLVMLSPQVTPLVGYLFLLMSLYGLLLSLIAVKAVYQISWFKSLIANFFLPVIFIGSIVSLLFISSPQVAQDIVSQVVTAIKNRDFSQLCSHFFQEDEEITQQIESAQKIIEEKYGWDSYIGYRGWSKNYINLVTFYLNIDELRNEQFSKVEYAILEATSKSFKIKPRVIFIYFELENTEELDVPSRGNFICYFNNNDIDKNQLIALLQDKAIKEMESQKRKKATSFIIAIDYNTNDEYSMDDAMMDDMMAY